MFAISYFHDKHIYHSDWSIYHNMISITLMYLGDAEGRGKLAFPEKWIWSACWCCFLSFQSPPWQSVKFVRQSSFNVITVIPLRLEMLLAAAVLQIKTCFLSQQGCCWKIWCIPFPGTEKSSFPEAEGQGPFGWWLWFQCLCRAFGTAEHSRWEASADYWESPSMRGKMHFWLPGGVPWGNAGDAGLRGFAWVLWGWGYLVDLHFRAAEDCQQM